jgi:hypothetical protein
MYIVAGASRSNLFTVAFGVGGAVSGASCLKSFPYHLPEAKSRKLQSPLTFINSAASPQSSFPPPVRPSGCFMGIPRANFQQPSLDYPTACEILPPHFNARKTGV